MSKLNYRFGWVFLAIFSVTGSLAQESGSATMADQDVADARAMIQEGRRTIIREDLPMTTEEEALFWPLYDQYRAELVPVQDHYIAMVSDYMRQYETGILTDEYAETMLMKHFEIKGRILKIRKSYIRPFENIMPMSKVARFYQLENKMNADVDAELAMVVPLYE
jgi:hypothetical protein